MYGSTRRLDEWRRAGLGGRSWFTCRDLSGSTSGTSFHGMLDGNAAVARGVSIAKAMEMHLGLVVKAERSKKKVARANKGCYVVIMDQART